MNAYGFAGGDRINFSDPMGLSKCCVAAYDGINANRIVAESEKYSGVSPRDAAGVAAMGVAAAAGGFAIMAGGAAAASGGMATFYRGVSSLEAAQISADGVMKAIGGIEGAKYLTNSYQAAQQWGTKMHGESARVAEVVVSKAAAAGFEALGRIDGIGQAWVARLDQLKNAAVRILPP